MVASRISSHDVTGVFLTSAGEIIYWWLLLVLVAMVVMVISCCLLPPSLTLHNLTLPTALF